MIFKRNKEKPVTPEQTPVHRSKLILSDDTAFVAKESYKAERTNIIFSIPNDGECSTILFTSSVPGEGKTTTCVNTALSFVHIGAKVLIIEADLRRPKVCECFNKQYEVGLSSVLSGVAELKDAIYHIDEENIDILPTGAVPPNPTELLSSVRMEETLASLKKDYDYIFIDTPPVNTVTDAVLLTKYVTGTIIVIRNKYTTRQALDKAINSLKFSNAKILGLIMNDAAIARSYTRYRGYKKYGSYSYGYGYYGSKKKTQKSSKIKKERLRSNHD